MLLTEYHIMYNQRNAQENCMTCLDSEMLCHLYISCTWLAVQLHYMYEQLGSTLMLLGHGMTTAAKYIESVPTFKKGQQLHYAFSLLLPFFPPSLASTNFSPFLSHPPNHHCFQCLKHLTVRMMSSNFRWNSTPDWSVCAELVSNLCHVIIHCDQSDYSANREIRESYYQTILTLCLRFILFLCG